MSAVAELSKLNDLLSAPAKPTVTDINFWHSDDYTEIRVGTIVHFLSRLQAAAIRIIHQEHLRGRLDVPGDRILKQIGSECTRMGELFRYSTLWQEVLISPFRRGYYSLAPFITIR